MNAVGQRPDGGTHWWKRLLTDEWGTPTAAKNSVERTGLYPLQAEAGGGGFFFGDGAAVDGFEEEVLDRVDTF